MKTYHVRGIVKQHDGKEVAQVLFKVKSDYQAAAEGVAYGVIDPEMYVFEIVVTRVEAE